MTFSLVARCAETGMLGIVIASSSPAVAARCAHVRAGVGAVATQNVTDPSLGPEVLDLLSRPSAPEDVLREMVTGRAHIQYRQLLAVDVLGRTATFGGANVLGLASQLEGSNCAAGGNLLGAEDVPRAMVECFTATQGSFGNRLVAALRAGREAGGEAGPVHSAGLKIADRLAWPWADLRCDWVDDGCPIEIVARAWEVYAPQAETYVSRALNPASAPAYGVPGDP
jgi:uncharacterized Ntn-hydrolase superfamily protein